MGASGLRFTVAYGLPIKPTVIANYDFLEQGVGLVTRLV